MRAFIRIALPLLALATVLWLGACSDDDPASPGGGGTDTTPPEVVGSTPADGAAAVGLADSVFVVFSEAMDTATAAGQVGMTPAANHGFTWYDDRTLAIGHDAWPEGTEVTVTLGAGLTDDAGNALAATSFSFWTRTTSGLLLLETTPADGAANVNRDAPVVLKFSADINLTTVAANVTIEDDVTKAAYDFAVSSPADGLVVLDPDGSLAATSTITVTVGTGVQAWQGAQTLAAEETFSFETGTDVDTTPPQITGFVPANGAMGVPADQGFIRLTFSEPVDPNTLEPSRVNFNFYVLMETMNTEPAWNPDGTELTFALPSPLPAGMPVEITFADLTDLAGNTIASPVTYAFRIAGAADYVPVVDGARFLAQEDWEEGTLVPDATTDSGFESWAVQLETQGDGTFRLVQYLDPDFASPLGWEAYRKSGNALQWLGFEEVPSPPPPVKRAPAKEMFDQPLTILPLPIAVGTWTSSTTVTIEGDGDYRATVDGQVVGQGDYSIAESGGSVFIKDAWTVVRQLDVEVLDGMTWLPAFTQTDTVWYAPAYGDARTAHYEESESDNSWYGSVTWHFPYSALLPNKGWTDPWDR